MIRWSQRSRRRVHVAATRYGRVGHLSSAATRITVAGRGFPLIVSSASRPIRPIPHRGDIWLPLALIPAMRQGLPVHVDEPLSPALLDALPAIQSTLVSWFPDLTVVRVSAPRGRVHERPTDATVQFFTGGVDSFFSLLNNRAEVAALVYVHGYDVPLAQIDHRRRVSRSLASASVDLGIPLVELESNARTLLDHFGDWGHHTHGAALASIALMLGADASRVILPSTHTIEEREPWGSHPDIDPLWSTATTTIEHHGVETSRFAKIAALTGEEVVSDHLRVCWNTTTELNCSDCEKCLRTMTAFDILGKLSDVRTFRKTLDLVRLADFPPTNDSELAFTIDNRDAARLAGRGDITAILDPIIERYLASPPQRPPFTRWLSQHPPHV